MLQLFSIAGIPVSVTLWYGLLLLFMGRGDLTMGILWGVCITVSLLVHEFGHALVARHYGLAPSIILHGFGGLTQHARAERDRDDMWIIAAGPGAGLALGITVLAVFYQLRVHAPHVLQNPLLDYTFDALIYINIYWSLVNLIPLWPLDGGQLFRLFLIKLVKRPAQAERITHATGLTLGLAGAVVGYVLLNSMLVLIIAGFCAWQNYAALRSTRATGPIRSQHRFGHELLSQAEQALEAGDFREAARLCHQIRVDSSVSDRQVHRLWTVLGIASVEIGEYEDARDALALVQPSPQVNRARAKLAVATGDVNLAREVLQDVGSAYELGGELMDQVRQLGASAEQDPPRTAWR